MHGNTVQNAEDLAFIRSVGDKVEGQELYEIPVVSSGKNLLCVDKLINQLNSVSANTVELVADGLKIMPGKSQINDVGFNFKYNKNKQHTITYNITSEEQDGSPATTTGWFIKVLYTDGTSSQVYALNGKVSFTTVINKTIEKICLSYGVTRYNTTITNIQIEEGTVATPYEPYQEDKLTILSPVQLEKVGDVADRIVCKDGVWGVEKNIKTYTVSQDVILTRHNVHDNGTTSYRIEGVLEQTNSIVITSKFKQITFSALFSGGNIGHATHESNTHLYVRLEGNTTINTAKQQLQGMLIKYVALTPQFIPLPHDQQIKLRTFANKTNISFLTEIEGTIKAQVPKSIGATVNTHTEQINNLNNELNRVKKLEESTVSTVTTESGFTTVEATTNGYFEDVKLEGRTLVNLANFKYSNSTTDRISWGVNDCKIVAGKVTLINNSNKHIGIDILTTENKWQSFFEVKANSRVLFDLNSSTKVGNLIGYFSNGWTANDLETLKQALIVLEGDHTQNPPSYFEGLKSVGEDTDEIVVSSVNKYSDISTKTPDIDNLKIQNQLQIPITESFSIVNPYHNKVNVVVFKDGSWLKDIEIGFGCNYIKLLEGEIVTYLNQYFRNGWGSNDAKKIKNILISTHQDKKRLLFYNEETQTWEKPILRQWDSIEKHADGKYYYHQRSAEVVLNGSENWAYQTSSDILLFYLNMPNAKGNQLELKTTYINLGSIDINNENIQINSLKNLIITINSTKLSTQDVQGFKQWLQANNVTVVYQLEEEKVYECTNIDLITYANETNYIVESGAIVPRTTLKVHNNISNVVSLLQKKVSLLEDKFIQGLKQVLAGDMYSLAELLYPEDFVSEEEPSDVPTLLI